jgi:hypothetical protein
MQQKNKKIASCTLFRATRTKFTSGETLLSEENGLLPSMRRVDETSNSFMKCFDLPDFAQWPWI